MERPIYRWIHVTAIKDPKDEQKDFAEVVEFECMSEK